MPTFCLAGSLRTSRTILKHCAPSPVTATQDEWGFIFANSGMSPRRWETDRTQSSYRLRTCHKALSEGLPKWVISL